MLFNLDFLRENTEGDTALEKELLQHFESTLAKCLKALEQHPEKGLEILHELKGVARTMGAELLAEACQQGEDGALSQSEYPNTLHHLSQRTLENMRQSL